ncbi:MAG: AGE family epimerase/isomerase [Oscillospiraceae bacterium]|nr:AGE family epimerase/isomerase [Oscillospiraceae bacterium]
MQKFSHEIKQHLTHDIIPFWNALSDRDNGGFYGYVSSDGQVDATYPKGAVLHLRILWFYAAAYTALKEPQCLSMATHCYDFIVKAFIDREHGGLYRMVSPKGTPIDTNSDKYGYCHAFFIYAMSAYYTASGNADALRHALEMFDLLVEKNPENHEFCDRKWNAANTNRTTGALLHFIEAYTEMWRVCDDPDRPRIVARVNALLQVVSDKLYDKDTCRLHEQFTPDYTTINNAFSYGHFVEAAWLIGRTLDILGDNVSADLTANLRKMNTALVDAADEIAFADNGGMYYEEIGGKVNRRMAWWTQAEGIVGFTDAYNRTGERKYAERAEGLWAFIKSAIIDQQHGNEWRNELDENGTPDDDFPLVNEWKCPYHNGRMALFVLGLL